MKIFLIDAFSSKKFAGNPTSVCLIERRLEYDELLSVAKELNMPVTAFVEKTKKEMDLFTIRYFTSTGEIPACGHATLASAKLIFELFAVKQATFKTIENIFIRTELSNDIITMTFPRYELSEFQVSTAMLQSLKLEEYRSAGFCRELETVFIELENPVLLKKCRPDFKELLHSSDTIKEVVITSLSDNSDYDFLLRSFCPWIGIDEDPVTGSVHSVLAGYWSQRLGKNKLMACQASERGGEIEVTSFIDKVHIGGKAITILEGNIHI